MADIDKFDLLFLIYNVQRNRAFQGLRFKKLMEFCNCDPHGKKDPSRPARCSYKTLINYKKELEAGNWLKKRIGPESGRPLYYVPTERYEDVENLRRKRDFNSFMSSVDSKWYDPLRNLMIKMKDENNKDPLFALDKYCFTFIGDVPIAFTKSVGAMKSHIAFERNLRKRHTRDLEIFHEEFITSRLKGKDSPDHVRINSRIRDEVGWTVGEYLKKLLKKAEKEKGIRRLMMVLGITEEMLEEMYRKQEMYEEKTQKKDEKKSPRKEKSTLKQKDEQSFLELIYGSG